MNQGLKLFTLDEAAAVAGVDRETIEEWIEGNKIRFYRSHTSAGRGHNAQVLIEDEDLKEAKIEIMTWEAPLD